MAVTTTLADDILDVTQSLKSFALYLTRDNHRAEDLVQDTILKALSNEDKFQRGTNLKAWLYTIMRNIFITNRKCLSNSKTFMDTTDNLYYINSGVSTIQNEAHNRFIAEDIKKALENTKSTYNKPFMMYCKGYKYREIAIILDIPIGTVKNRIHCARKQLEKRLRVYRKLYD